MVPLAALEQEAAQERLTKVAANSVKRLWRLMRGRNWESAWRDDVGPRVVEVIEAGQAAAAARSSQYLAEVLAELDVELQTSTKLLSDAFAGVGGDGLSVESHAYGAVVTAAKAQYTPSLADLLDDQRADAALAVGGNYLDGIVASILADTARAAEVVATAQRPWVTGYIRMIEPGACSRCAVLAGKFYLFNSGFERHPRCRCIHVPAMEDIPHDPRTNPMAYFDSLSKKEQDEVFTNAGAEAVRLGADISQVVNARRGMNTAQQNPRGWISKGRMVPTDVFGQPLFTTTEGVTRHGVGRKAMGTGRPVRLMPESILALAKSPEDAIRLLKLYGYLK